MGIKPGMSGNTERAYGCDRSYRPGKLARRPQHGSGRGAGGDEMYVRGSHGQAHGDVNQLSDASKQWVKLVSWWYLLASR